MRKDQPPSANESGYARTSNDHTDGKVRRSTRKKEGSSVLDQRKAIEQMKIPEEMKDNPPNDEANNGVRVH